MNNDFFNEKKIQILNESGSTKVAEKAYVLVFWGEELFQLPGKVQTTFYSLFLIHYISLY